MWIYRWIDYVRDMPWAPVSNEAEMYFEFTNGKVLCIYDKKEADVIRAYIDDAKKNYHLNNDRLMHYLSGILTVMYA